MTVKEKAEAVFKHYKELNSDLEFNYDNRTMYELKNQNIMKTLYYIAMHADAVLLADTFTGRRLFNIALTNDAFYEFASYLNRYDFDRCKVQIYLKCDLEIQALLVAVSLK